MVQLNIGNHGHARFGDVRRVQTAAHAHFEHCKIDTSPREMQKSRRGEEFKKAWAMRQHLSLEEAINGLPNFGEGDCEVVVRNLAAVNPDSFIHANQVRRSIETGFIAGAGENPRQHGRR